MEKRLARFPQREADVRAVIAAVVIGSGCHWELMWPGSPWQDLVGAWMLFKDEHDKDIGLKHVVVESLELRFSEGKTQLLQSGGYELTANFDFKVLLVKEGDSLKLQLKYVEHFEVFCQEWQTKIDDDMSEVWQSMAQVSVSPSCSVS